MEHTKMQILSSNSIIEDERAIECLNLDQMGGFTVGKNGVEKITPYLESNGSIWFMVHADGKAAPVVRVPYTAVCYLMYEKEENSG